MFFDKIKEKLGSIFSNIKAKFNPNYSDNDKSLTVDSYFNEENKDIVNTGTETIKKAPENKVSSKNKLEEVKNFIVNAEYNPFADNDKTKEQDIKEFKANWFMTLIKIIVMLVMLFLIVVCSVVIYKIGYNLLNNTEVSKVGDYSDFIVPEDNLSPTINQNDLIIVKGQDFYEIGDIILYEYAGSSHKLGKVADTLRNYYIITDNNISEEDTESKIAADLIVGKEVYTINHFEGIYTFITSPITIAIIVVIIALYFYLISKGKIKDRAN